MNFYLLQYKVRDKYKTFTLYSKLVCDFSSRLQWTLRLQEKHASVFETHVCEKPHQRDYLAMNTDQDLILDKISLKFNDTLIKFTRQTNEKLSSITDQLNRCQINLVILEKRLEDHRTRQ